MSTVVADVRQARRGNRAAYGRLIARHAVAVHRVAMAITGDPTLAEDIAQDTFLRGWQGLRRLEDPARFSGWLMGIARHRALDVARRRRIDRPEASIDVTAVALGDPEGWLDRKRMADALWGAVDELEPGQRDVLHLYYREGRSVAEVARQLGLTAPAVRKRLSRGRAHLRDEVVEGMQVHRVGVVGLAALGFGSRVARAAIATVGIGAFVAVLGAGWMAATTVVRVQATLPEVPAALPRSSGMVAWQAMPVAPSASSDPAPQPAWPVHVVRAFLAAEDARFFEHGGVDPQAMARAVWRTSTDGAVQGGSTITQQLAKHMLPTRARTIDRKLAEVLLAWELERELDKATILDRYLSSVYFGRGAFGVPAAARTYFDRSVGDLSLGQAALLAALPAAPSAHDPRAHPEAARARRRWVLDRMVTHGWVSRRDADKAAAEPMP